MMRLPLAALVFLASLAGGPAPMQEVRPPDGLVLKAEAFVDALTAGDFDAAARDFDATMLRVSGPDRLAAFWKEAPARLSPFRRRTSSRRDKLGAYDIVLVTCEFERQTLDARIVFDAQGRIAGFQFIPVAPPPDDRPAAYVRAESFEESDLTVGGPAWPLPAVLTTPRGRGPFPAVVLVHGSGPNDRDETIGPNKPFRDLAWGLASAGIAVLRYEKRTRVFGARLAAGPDFGRFTVREEAVDDAAAAVRLLKGRAEIDPGRVFILGHSLGGALLPRISEALGQDRPAGFISLAGATRPLPETMIRQVEYLSGLDGRIEPGERKAIEDLKAQAAAINALGEKDRGSTAVILGAPAAYWLDLRGYDPAAAMRTAPEPILVLQGGRDYQVTVEDFENWRKALSGRKNAVFKLLPACNHLFFEGTGPSAPAEYQVPGHMSGAVIEAVAGFVKDAPGAGAKR
jgi:dienelactone hydrolase